MSAILNFGTNVIQVIGGQSLRFAHKHPIAAALAAIAVGGFAYSHFNKPEPSYLDMISKLEGSQSAGSTAVGWFVKPLVQESHSWLQKLQQAPRVSPTFHGLYREGNNCWVNTLFQMVYADARVRKWLLSPQCPKKLQAFQTFAQQYRASSGNVAIGNSQTLRKCIHALNSKIDSSHTHQEDVTEGWMAINDLLPLDFQGTISETITYERGRNQPVIQGGSMLRTRVIPSSGVITLDLHGTHLEFDNLMQRYMDNTDVKGADCKLQGIDGKEHRYKMVREQRQFVDGPPSLWILLKRFVGDKKISTPVKKVPLTRQIQTTSGKSQTYRLNAFAVHSGDSLHSGHYYAVVRDPVDDKWYKLDDVQVQHVPISALDDQLKQAYFLNYSS